MPIPTNKDIAEVTYNGVTIPLVETGGEESVQEIFDVTYGTTPFEDIDAAYQAGKVCRLIRSGEIYFLTKFSTNSVMFWHIGTGGVRKFVACSSDNVWQSANANVQTTSSKVTEITDTSTDAQYPSAKAVYDLVQSSGGGSDSVFVVEYDETPFADIYSALQAGKVCYFDYIGERFYSFKFAPNVIYFFYIWRAGIKKWAACSSSTGWTEIINDPDLLTENDVVTEITSSSTDTKVPSAKAVYDLVQSSGDSKISCTDEQVASYGYLKLSDLPVWDGSVV